MQLGESLSCCSSCISPHDLKRAPVSRSKATWPLASFSALSKQPPFNVGQVSRGETQEQVSFTQYGGPKPARGGGGASNSKWAGPSLSLIQSTQQTDGQTPIVQLLKKRAGKVLKILHSRESCHICTQKQAFEIGRFIAAAA